MNTKIFTLLLLVLVGCAGNGKKSSVNVPSDIKEEDFKPAKKVGYNSTSDRYNGISSSVVSDETLGGLNEGDYGKNLVEDDLLGKIAQECYERDFEKAFELIKENYSRYKENPIYWNQLGNCYQIKGERRKALLYYNKALEFKTSYSPVFNNIGLLYYSEDRDQKALVGFEKASSSDSYAKTPKLNLARLYLKYNLADKAFPILAGLIRMNGDDQEVRALLAHSYLMKKDYNKSLEWFTKLSSEMAKKPSNAVNFALAYYKTGNKEKAQDVLKDIELAKASTELQAHIREVSNKIGAQL